MTKNSIKSIIDSELRQIELTDEIKNNIKSKAVYHKSNRMWKGLAASIVIIVLGGTTVYAGYHILNKVYVNEEILTELDSMQIVQMNELDTIPNEYGIINKDYRDYNAIKNDLGVKLLDTDLSFDNPYMLCRVMTDTKDFAIITVKNFILGDTDNYQFIESENRYSYSHGTEFFSPVSLTVDLILSESQMSNGWDSDYLGLYEFVESYTSDQGYKVNIIKDTVDEENLEDYVSEKAAIFVANGVRYSLKGRVSIDTLKNIVNTMK